MNRLIGIKTWVVIATLLIAMFGNVGVSARDVSGYLDDSTITAKVKAVFLADRHVNTLNINVTTVDGVVELSGYANSQDEVNRAVQLARNVTDVKSVTNNIRLNPSSPNAP